MSRPPWWRPFVDADSKNGTPLYSIQRVMRDKAGEQ